MNFQVEASLSLEYFGIEHMTCVLCPPKEAKDKIFNFIYYVVELTGLVTHGLAHL